MTPAGHFRERIAFERRTTDETDEYGNPVKEFEAMAGLDRVPADIRETPGKEKVASGALESTRTATIRVRKASAVEGITPADRIIARGQVWNIRSGPVPIGRPARVLEFVCETGVAT